MNLPIKSKLLVDFVNVGHGDCTLITWQNNIDKLPWHCIIDTGDGFSKANKAIDEVISERKIKKFDLAILTHFDSDHIGGFSHILDKVKIARYWSPYTPAFEKYLWLFGQRGIDAIKRAKFIEEKLLQRNTIIESPVDSCILSPACGLKITVLSPPIKLFEKLLEGMDIDSLFGQSSTFLGDLVSDNSSYELEGSNRRERTLVRSMYSRLISGIIKRDIQEENRDMNDDSIYSVGIKVNKELICESMKIEPEFFGNNVLNDSSLVFKIECWTGTKWFSMLFPGDLENWLYLVSRHSDALKSDLYKVSHHGGKIHIRNKDAFNEVIQTIRPDISVISANGKHKLPRNITRNALIRWSTSIFCTQNRCKEYFGIDGSVSAASNNCCSDTYKCEPKERGICFKLEHNKITVDSQSCYGTFSVHNYPIIQFEQHLIPDSKILTRLTESEITKQTNWVFKKLKEIHEERKKGLNHLESQPIDVNEIHSKSIQEKRNLTEKQINLVFEYGYSNNRFWAMNYNYKWEYAYYKPEDIDIKTMWNIINNSDVLLFNINRMEKGITSNIQKAKRDLLCEYIERKTAFPHMLIQSYCWPLLTERLLKHYNIYNVTYTPYKSEVYNWLMLVKNKKDYKKIILEEYPNFRVDGYFEKDNFKEYSERYVNGDHIIRICSRLDNYNDNRGNSTELAKSCIYDIFEEMRSTSHSKYLIVNKITSKVAQSI